MPSNERRSAQALLNSWNRQITRWQAQADSFTGKWINYPDRASVKIDEYLAFAPSELSSYQTVSQFRAALDMRKISVLDKVQSQDLSAQYFKDGVKFPVGYLVYLAVCYNHGYGAYFVGYGPDEDGDFEPTDIDEWV